MAISPKLWRRLGIVLSSLVALGFCIRTWLVPTLIIRQIRADYHGRVTIRGWWLGSRSAGVIGLVLHEGSTASSPVWASAEEVATDQSLGTLLAGRFSPSKITLKAARVRLRINRDGRLLTRIPFSASERSPSTAQPELNLDDAQVTFLQEGRPEMVVARVGARLAPAAPGARLSARTDDPTWGHWEATGQLDRNFQTGIIQLRGTSVAAEPAKMKRVPFVTEKVWEHVSPRGRVDVELVLVLASDPDRPIRTRTVVVFQQTDVALPSLGLNLAGTTGALTVENSLVRLDQIAGRAIDGHAAASGTLDFSRWPAQFHLALRLDQVDVARSPKSWQLGELGATGRLTGQARLLVALSDAGTDLTGTSGHAVIEGGTLQGIPIKSLRLLMKAKGDLRNGTGAKGTRVLAQPALNPVSFPDPLPAMAAIAQGSPPARGVRLPTSISTEFELEHVDLRQIAGRVEALGIHIPVAVSGRLSLQAQATIPLDSLSNPQSYSLAGQVALNDASVAGVEIGRMTANVDLAGGLLEVKELRGRLVDRPAGGTATRAEPAVPVAAQGPLPPGDYRGRLKAEIAPPGILEASFEGTDLPLGRVAAPALGKLNSLSGLVTLKVQSQGRVGALDDPKAWTATGRAESGQLAYQSTTLDSVATKFTLAAGRVELTHFVAQLGGQPLEARFGLDLTVPHAFAGQLDVAGWSLADLLAFIPDMPALAPLAGALRAHSEAEGTLSPLVVQGRGNGRLSRFRAGPVPLGDVAFRWTTEGDRLLTSVIEARPLGGRIEAEFRVPLDGAGPSKGSATFSGIDAAQLSAVVPSGGLKLNGKADGQATLVVPRGASAIEANIRLTTPNLTVQGLPAEELQATLRAHQGMLKYEVRAESLNGRIKIQGDVPLTAPDPAVAIANAQVQASGVALFPLWSSLGVTGPMANLDGLGEIDADLRTFLSPLALWARGVAEFSDLRWGSHYPLGHLRGILALTPASWRVEPVTGELLGGTVRGALWGNLPVRSAHRLGFELEVEQALLPHALAMLPTLARHVAGAGTLRLKGSFEEGLNANAEIYVTRARVFGLPLSHLRVPADLIVTPGSGTGSIHLRRWSAHLAGGQVRGDARFLLGADRAFHAETVLTNVEVETFSRIESEARRPSSGKISGRIMLTGPHPALLSKLKGKVELDLDDASLVDLPVLRELDRFLGSVGGGVFEDGDLTGTIANKQLIVDELTLVGRAVQMHATGTVGFDGQVNLVALVNTNQIISQSGQALLALIPGLRDGLGRGPEASARVSNYLSSRLLKFRITGAVRSPSVSLDPSIAVGDAAVGFFAGSLNLPMAPAR